MVLDLTSGRLSDAIIHVQKALESVESRLAELRDGLAGQLPPLPPSQQADDTTKGKSKLSGRLVRDDYVQNMSKTQIENEIKELHGLRDDLELKVSLNLAFYFDDIYVVDSQNQLTTTTICRLRS
jgi:HAT1-interacting factor 1